LIRISLAKRPDLKIDKGAEDGRGEERESSGNSSESHDLNQRVRCEYCGNALRRLARQGFMQKEIYSRFGYYPWECPLCREPMLVRQQHRLKKRSEDEHEGMGTARTGAS
jgi:DNA-directed RNA polymerase subunit RPC12/RpoP